LLRFNARPGVAQGHVCAACSKLLRHDGADPFGAGNQRNFVQKVHNQEKGFTISVRVNIIGRALKCASLPVQPSAIGSQPSAHTVQPDS
jgi:hypothetical protein